MVKKAEIHNVGLKINPKTRAVANAPMPHGCKFTSEKSCTIVGASSRGSTGKRLRLQSQRPSFIYLDVGVWAGKRFDFGLICGRNVWLCRFTPDRVHQPIADKAWCPSPSKAPEPLRVFDREAALTNKHGFKVVTYAHIPPGPGPVPPANLLYLILPDMHMPAIPHKKEFKDKTYQQITTIYKDDKIVFRKEYNPVIPRNQLAKYAAFRRATDADIFAEAGDALYKFLDFVTDLLLQKLDRKLKVIHIGDMYELWQGMGEWSTYFDKDPNTTGLILEKDAVSHLKARVEGIETQNRRPLMQFKYLETLNAIEYLYGNHDVYLVDKMRFKDRKWNKALGDRGQRRTHLFENSVAFEHGHRMDGFNVDGNWLGPFITDLVFWVPGLRALDPDRREMYHTMAAIDVYYHNYFLKRPMSVFVMGHTHAADLKQIRLGALPDGDRRKSQCFTCKS